MVETLPDVLLLITFGVWVAHGLRKVTDCKFEMPTPQEVLGILDAELLVCLPLYLRGKGQSRSDAMG